MKPSNPIHFPDFNHEHREAFIRSFSQRTGEQAGQFLTEFLAGILILLSADKPQGPVKSPTLTRETIMHQGSE